MTERKQPVILESNSKFYHIDRPRIIDSELCRRSTLGYDNINKMLLKKRSNPTSVAILIEDIKTHFPNAIKEVNFNKVS